MAATAVRPLFFCELKSTTPAAPIQLQIQKSRTSASSPDNVKIVLQPRLCTLRSYGSDRAGAALIKPRNDVVESVAGAEVPRFFATLSDYIESSRKSQDFETISGRLAMIVFAVTVTTEVVTGNSLLRKMDLEGIAEAAGLCLLSVAGAATFAWFSCNRKNVGGIFNLGCNSLIDSLIDQIVDGLFYESELSDWSDEK